MTLFKIEKSSSKSFSTLEAAIKYAEENDINGQLEKTDKNDNPAVYDISEFEAIEVAPNTLALGKLLATHYFSVIED